MKRPIVSDIVILRQVSAQVDQAEALSIIKDLEDSLDTNKGIGLSAIQIGIAKKVSIIRFGNIKIDLINAEILEKEDRFRMVGEGCLSLSGLKIDTARYKYIKVNNNGQIFTAEGLEAVAIQHELDHEKGFTILNRKWKSR